MDVGFIFGQMDNSIKVNIIWTKNKATEAINGKMVNATLENG